MGGNELGGKKERVKKTFSEGMKKVIWREIKEISAAISSKPSEQKGPF